MPTGQAIDSFRRLWDEPDDMPDLSAFFEQWKSITTEERLRILLLDQHRRWKIGDPRPVAQYLNYLEGFDPDDELKVELLDEEIGYLEERDGEVDVSEFLSHFPDLSAKVRERLGLLDSNSQSTHSQSTVRSRPSRNAPTRTMRTRIGRYDVIRQLGKGSFGVVYLANDSELEREIAIKLPSQERLELAGGADSFLREARLVAALDDTGIVPVYDVGKLETGECYVVSKYIRGGDLRRFMREQSLSDTTAASLTAKLAKSLHQAHRNGLVHRDIKPGNILMDADGQPHIIDFGLALARRRSHERNNARGNSCLHEPRTSSRRGHRVDPRSDIYSLGVVLYEMLTGKRPHRATNTTELLELVKHVESSAPTAD